MWQEDNMKSKSFRISAALILTTLMLVLAAATTGATAQTLTTLHSFHGADGATPDAGLVQATNGDLYGTTAGGLGPNSGGTVFRITPSGTLATLYRFCAQGNCADGRYPYAGLVQATNGDLYATTFDGGPSGYGTVFKITPSGTLTTLYRFCAQTNCPDGEFPEAGLVQATGGNFYGTTSAGGTYNHGTVFKITPGGTLTTLYSFCSLAGCADGEEPLAGLVQATNGDFYGTTYSGGANSDGTVFKVTPSGTLTTLYSFCSLAGCADGATPVAGLVQATNGDLYGTTYLGGANSDGAVFKITPSGTLTTLYSFCSLAGCADGQGPWAGLVQATDGNFYGTTYSGGANSDGTVFKITPSGTLTTLYSFCSLAGCADGEEPRAGLVQATNGDLYGTTTWEGAGSKGAGTVFSLSVGLGPFVSFVRGSGKVGQTAEILGQGFTGTTGVSFNGTAATFAVVRDTFLMATVPTGATTGSLTVTTPGGTLTSNQPFRVTPQILSFTPPSGAVGTPVTITGNSLTQTTNVLFGGVKVTIFTVDADTQVTATVPAGAVTGPIALTTKGGKTTSLGAFTVTQ
jgi:uncharacterized repeat protein (TIGR03803 family)